VAGVAGNDVDGQSAGAGGEVALEKPGSSSFLKKRTKKLLTVARRCRFTRVSRMLPETDKSFLVLFFKKELLPSFLISLSTTAFAQQAAPSAAPSEQILVKARQLLLKARNSPSAATELGARQITAAGVAGNAASLLRQAPSIYEYQYGLGDSTPEFSIRGVRGLESAETLDGVPMQDLLAPGITAIADNLGNSIGNYFELSQISGVTIIPGVAYPDQNTFGTIGGTIAFDSKRPSAQPSLDVSGSVGSFQTWREGFEFNTGALDSVLGSGDNAPRALLSYQNLQSAGFIDHLGTRENNFEAAFDKPYNDGLSMFQATVLFNTGEGYVENEPIPQPYQEKYGLFSNFPTSENFGYQDNRYLTLILKDDTYVSDMLKLGLTGFYRHNDNQLETYGSLSVTPPVGDYNPAAVGTAYPFIDTPAGFGYAGFYGPGGVLYKPGVYTYTPLAAYPPGSAACPKSFVAEYAAVGQVAPCGLNAQLNVGSSDTYGVQPRATVFLPSLWGIENTLKIGGLFAKETSPATRSYFGGTPDVPQTPGNLDTMFGGGFEGGFDGGTQRTILQTYAQDKIDLLDNTLHVTPGVTLEASASGFRQSEVFNFALGGFAPYKATKWDRDYLPFLNVSYDFARVLPAAAGLSVYGSTGQSALFAPVSDFGPNGNGAPPNASIVHLYEGGARYDTSSLLLSVDYFYQKIDRDFSYFTNVSLPETGLSLYSDVGQRETKGVEGAVQWQVTPELQLFGNFSHVLAKYLTNYFAYVTVAEDQYGIAFKGAPVAGVPNWLSTFGVDWSRKSSLSDNDDLNVRFGATYTGSQPITYNLEGDSPAPNFPGLPPDIGICTVQSAQSANPPPACARFAELAGATVYDPHQRLSPFAVFNLDLTYKLPTPWLRPLRDITFDLNVQNLFDERYYQYYYVQISPGPCPATPSNPVASPFGCSPNFAQGVPGEPFSVFFTATAHF
jgi:iron complex outermembrane receptor protein